MTTGPVCATIVHSSGSVVATCSGRDRVSDIYLDDSSDSESSEEPSEVDDGGSSVSSASTLAEQASYDASLKLWSL